MNAHEAAFAIVCLLSFVRQQTPAADGTPRLNGWGVVGAAFVLAAALALTAGGSPRAMALYGFQALIEAVGGTAFVGYAAGKAKGAAPALLLAFVVAGVSACAKVAPAVTPTLDLGCELVAILDPAAQAIATVCADVVNVVGPIIADEVTKLGYKRPMGEAVYQFVDLTYQGKKIGKVRTDVAAAVQARLDALGAAK